MSIDDLDEATEKDRQAFTKLFGLGALCVAATISYIKLDSLANEHKMQETFENFGEHLYEFYERG